MRISAGGYSFGNWLFFGVRDTETLIGPPISWNELARQTVQEGKCALVLLMSVCPMELVSLDNEQIVDYSPAGADCGRLGRAYFGRYIRKHITPGSHRLMVRQVTDVRDRDFKAEFECEDGETIYAELDVDDVWGGWKEIIDAKLAISNSPLKKHIIITPEKPGLFPILWHKGEWYGPPTSNSSGVK